MVTIAAPLFALGCLIGCRVGAAAQPVPRSLTQLGLGTLYAATCLILGADDVGELVLGLCLCTVLVAVTLTDLRLRLIPNSIVIAGAAAAAATVIVADAASLGDRAVAALAGGGALLAVALAHPRGMGMGDVKLVAMMGLYLGRAIAPALLVGFAAGAAVGAAIIVRHGPAGRKLGIPFGPFLALGGVIGLWFGDQLVDWYLDEFLSADRSSPDLAE